MTCRLSISGHIEAAGDCESQPAIYLRNQTENGFEEERLVYEKGIEDYVREVAGDDALTEVQVWSGERKGRDRADKPEYKAVFNVAFCFSNRKDMLEYYHNSSWLEHGGSPERAVRSAFVSKIDGYLKQNGKMLRARAKSRFRIFRTALFWSRPLFDNHLVREPDQKAISNRFYSGRP